MDISKRITRKTSPESKTFFHHRSKHRESYDFSLLCVANENLAPLVRPNKFGVDSIDFSNPTAVKELNTALLKHFYNLDYWDIPKNYLCPPIPGRADYIHHVADLFMGKGESEVPKLKCLDIGVGANCIYPIIGIREYGWSFLASDIDKQALENIEQIVEQNKGLKSKIKLKLQENSSQMLHGVLGTRAKLDVVMCNPPFHESAEAAAKANARKVKNLGLNKKGQSQSLNFGGQSTELWCDGGERKFINQLITESVDFQKNVTWFTTLVSKKENVNPLVKSLEAHSPTKIKIIKMNQGNKSSRVLAWKF